MPAAPTPTGLRTLVEDCDVGKHRRLFCEWYDHCLDEAVHSNWPSWTCEYCPLFAVESPASSAWL